MSRNSLISQYKIREVNCSKKEDYFEDILYALQDNSNLQTDIVICPQVSTRAEVKFIWNGYALNSIQIIGIIQ